RDVAMQRLYIHFHQMSNIAMPAAVNYANPRKRIKLSKFGNCDSYLVLDQLRGGRIYLIFVALKAKL
ncbi:hypothetical protein, partial [Nostoc sp. UHCC 0251]|uniref:hypothetical protein n=1 Tax=Nostoc sp. UHCC 0251 TaxID=3110240 RepID=UPI002B201F78